MERIEIAGLRVAAKLYDFIRDEALPGTGMATETFWGGLAALFEELGAQNQQLLDKRKRFQERLDEWHRAHKGEIIDMDAYETFLREIGYIVPEGDDFTIGTEGLDAEITDIPGPQLVVPVNNARYALNATNARWGSLYSALYGTDALGTGAMEDDQKRTSQIIARGRDFLDETAPLENSSWTEAVGFAIDKEGLVVCMPNGRHGRLRHPDRFAGYSGETDNPTNILLVNHGLHIDIVIDRSRSDPASNHASIGDIILESALTTIMDLEDSVSAVDAADKAIAYRHWLGLIKGDLCARFARGGKTIERRFNLPRRYLAPDGSEFHLKSQALLLNRNVGMHMTNPAILLHDGEEAFEGIMDAMITTLIAMRDKEGRNAAHGAIYIVKPKMHGPEEVAFTVRLFERVEEILGLETETVKLGIMDEERRTTVNLKECIRAARRRIFFINTGFLDRTGDEIHTSMEAGPMLRKGDMKNTPWLQGYEDQNVDVGLHCGFCGRGQISKGMWAMPDRMAAMQEQKIAHPNAGADTAWVPSPTAAVIHAVHYHQVDVKAVQEVTASRPPARLCDILTIPVTTHPDWTQQEIQDELDNNIQGILGYVVRWIDQGIGCSKVPDINNVGLMEDRATLRISSQHIANWLHHGIVNKAQVVETMKRMAKIVDKQNAGDPLYQPMTGGFDSSVAFKAALDLVLKGRRQPNGYTEFILHARRRQKKARL